MNNCRQPAQQSLNPLSPQSLLRVQSFSSLSTYYETKKQSKELRVKQFMERKQNQEAVKIKRAARTKNVKKKEFQSWFLPKRRYEEMHNMAAQREGMEFMIRVATMVERLPIVLPDPPEWEEEYEDMKAYLFQFGRTYPSSMLGEMEIEEPHQITKEALLELLPRGFTPAPRETEADKTGDTQTLDRKLKEKLFLFVKDEDPHSETDSLRWQFPTVDLRGNETLLDAAKRSIIEKVGDIDSPIEIYAPSNCPVGIDMTVFPEKDRQDSNVYGVKTFFMKLQYDEGEVAKDRLVDEFAWLSREELVEQILQQDGENRSKLYHYLT